jgi:hypothetical protein
MRQVSLGPLAPNATVQQTLDWLVLAVREFENASTEEPVAVFDSYSSDVAPTTTRQVNVTTPTTANLAAVLASLIADMRKRGINKTT